MSKLNRREFLRDATAAAATLAVQSSEAAHAQLGDRAGTRIIIDTDRRIAELDPRVFGSFLEHLGRAIYEGIYDAGNRLSDSQGFRKDVAAEIKSMAVPIVRY